MKAKLSVLALFTALSWWSSASAAVTITFNAPFVGGMSSGFANSAGVVSNGMTWGIIVDTTGFGFYSAYDLALLTPGTSLSLTTSGGIATGDRLIVANDLTSDSSQGGVLLEGNLENLGGNGGISGITFSLGNGVAAGQKFVIFWVDSSNLRFGALLSPQFIVPSDGQTVTYDQVFVGADPVRLANNGYLPEPSSLLLGAVGLLGLLRRRR